MEGRRINAGITQKKGSDFTGYIKGKKKYTTNILQNTSYLLRLEIANVYHLYPKSTFREFLFIIQKFQIHKRSSE